jgi:hypothetical protein
MTTRSFKIAAIAAAFAATPMLGVAANAPVALNSCVKAFMADLSNKSPGTLKLRNAHYEDDIGSSDTGMTLPGSRDEMVLTARDAHDNHAVARAVCTVNSQGEVVELRAAPLFGADTL